MQQTSQLQTALPDAEQTLEKPRLQWEDKKSCLLEELQQETSSLEKALLQEKEELKVQRVQVMEEKVSIMKALRSVSKCVEDRKRELKRSEEELRRKLEELQSRIIKLQREARNHAGWEDFTRSSEEL